MSNQENQFVFGTAGKGMTFGSKLQAIRSTMGYQAIKLAEPEGVYLGVNLSLTPTFLELPLQSISQSQK